MSAPLAAAVPQPTRPRLRWLLRYVVTPIVAMYLGVVVMLSLLENWLVYPGTWAGTAWIEPDAAVRARDVWLPTPFGRIHAWWCVPPDWNPANGAVLHSHGNGSNISQYEMFAFDWQHELNQAVLLYDYPGYGKSTGSPSEAGCYAAADAAYEWLRTVQTLPADRLILLGESIGGGVAVDLASRRPARALVLIKTFTSLPDTAQTLYPFLPVHWIMRNRYDSLSKIGCCTLPLFQLHGDLDQLVPIEQGKRLFAAANEPKRFIVMPGGGHNSDLPANFFASVRAFLTEVEAGNTVPQPTAAN